MAFQIDTGYATLAGTKAINEDFCGAMLPDRGQEEMGAIAAVADGVSTGGGSDFIIAQLSQFVDEIAIGR